MIKFALLEPIIPMERPKIEQKELELQISPETLREIEEMINKKGMQRKTTGDNFSSVTRVLHWLELCDCAIISAWRKTKNREKNDSDNRELQESLRKGKYGVIKMRGYYPEKGQSFSNENSFLTINLEKETIDFFGEIKSLSENYEQDCFLFKKAGIEEQAILVGTNEDFGIGIIKPLGPLKLSSTPLTDKSSTKIGNKWIFTEA